MENTVSERVQLRRTIKNTASERVQLWRTIENTASERVQLWRTIENTASKQVQLRITIENTATERFQLPARQTGSPHMKGVDRKPKTSAVREQESHGGWRRQISKILTHCQPTNNIGRFAHGWQHCAACT